MTGCSGLASPPSAFQEDFENGSAGWEGGETMAQDAAVAHGGARALRLAVADPMRDAVYVTRKVPVEGGAYYAASCFVKIDNVVEAPGVKPSAGAGERGEALFLVSHGIAPDAKGISMKTEWLERMLSSADGLGVVVRGIR